MCQTLDKDSYKSTIDVGDDEGPVNVTIVDCAGVDENAAFRDRDYRGAGMFFVITFFTYSHDV